MQFFEKAFKGMRMHSKTSKHPQKKCTTQTNKISIVKKHQQTHYPQDLTTNKTHLQKLKENKTQNTKRYRIATISCKSSLRSFSSPVAARQLIWRPKRFDLYLPRCYDSMTRGEFHLRNFHCFVAGFQNKVQGVYKML